MTLEFLLKLVLATYESVHAIVRELKRGEAELNENIADEENNVPLQPVHVHHKVLKHKQYTGYGNL